MPPRSEPRSRHEPSMLDKLAGATLVNPTDRAPVVGVIVLGVNPWSAMWRNGLRPSDVIVAVDRDRVRSLDELERALGRVTWGFVLEVVRHGERIRIFVP
jgi:S1-C subfamily serine protease